MEETPTRESDFDKELGVSIFDLLADRYRAGDMTLEDVVTTFHELTDHEDE